MAQVKDVYNIVSMYENLKEKFMHKTTFKVMNREIVINANNLKYAKDWLLQKEDRLERANTTINNVSRIRNARTLYKEIGLLENVMYWFNEYDLKQITDEQLKRVLEQFDRGQLKSRRGTPLTESASKDYYTKVFRGDKTFFGFLKLNHRAKDILVKKFEVREEVRYFNRQTFDIIIDKAENARHRVCFWLLYDTGIEVNAICQLTKSDFILDNDLETKQEFYKVRVPKDISKKTRQKRYIDIIHPECNNLLKSYLQGMKDDERIFDFNPPAIYKALKLIVRKYNLHTIGDVSREITTKDFRSSCATDMLNNNWEPYQVNVRLGHTISSRELDRYISSMNLDQKKPRQAIQNSNYNDLLEMIKKIDTTNRRLDLELKDTREQWKKLSAEYIDIDNRIQFMYDALRDIPDNEINPKIKSALEFLWIGKKDYVDADGNLELFPLYPDKETKK